MAVWTDLESTWLATGTTWAEVSGGDPSTDLTGTSTTYTSDTATLEVTPSINLDLVGTSITYTSAPSAALEVLTASFGAPANVTVEPLSQSSMAVSWDAVATATFYNVERQRWDGSSWVSTATFTNVTATSLADSSLEPATQYRYRVRAGKAA